MDEVERILAEFARRERTLPGDFYSLTRPVNLFTHQQSSRHFLRLLAAEALIPLAGKKILDVGCGEGGHLLEMEKWGARRADLAGIDLIESRVARARTRLGDQPGPDSSPDVRVGSASELPWPAGRFDIVHQNTVFTSIIDDRMKRAVAGEILRVLKPDGVLIWYDFLFNNPTNPHVKGIGAREIRSLFPDCVVRLSRVTLAPPLARRLVPVTWIGSLLLEKLHVFNTHYLAIVRKREGPR